jgi:hypothetical protein
LGAPAWAIDTTKYPRTLVDSTCTDTEDTPSPTTVGAVKPGGFVPAPTVQLTGSADGYCDHDSRILTGAIVADTTFGPFISGQPGSQINGLVIFTDGDTVTGGDTKYHIAIAVPSPHDEAVIEFDAFALATGNGNTIWTIGRNAGTPAGVTETLLSPIPDTFYIILDLNTATSWTGDISIMAW